DRRRAAAPRAVERPGRHVGRARRRARPDRVGRRGRGARGRGGGRARRTCARGRRRPRARAPRLELHDRRGTRDRDPGPAPDGPRERRRAVGRRRRRRDARPAARVRRRVARPEEDPAVTRPRSTLPLVAAAALVTGALVRSSGPLLDMAFAQGVVAAAVAALATYALPGLAAAVLVLAVRGPRVLAAAAAGAL